MAAFAEEKEAIVLEDEDNVTRNAELITDALQRRLSYLRLCIPPITAIHKADVIFHVSKSSLSSSPEEEEEEEKQEGKEKGIYVRTEEEQETENGKKSRIVRILAHSSVLKRECDYFREILQEEEKIEEEEDDSASMVSVPDSDSSFTDSQCSSPKESELSSPKHSECSSPKDSECSVSRKDHSEYLLWEQNSNASGEDYDSVSLGMSNEEKENDPILKQQNVSPTRKNRGSILLKDRPWRSRRTSRKGSVSSSTGSHRKSVRFSINPADVIPLMKDTNNEMQKNEEAKDSRGNQSGHKEVKKVDRIDEDDDDDKIKEPTALKITYTDKPMIKRRNTEVNIMIQNQLDEKQVNKGKKEKEGRKDSDSLRYFVVKKHNWTSRVLVGILEWLYVGIAHIDIIDLPAIYDAAYRAAITSLTWCIKRHPIVDYLNLAITNYPTNCQSLLDLCDLADCQDLSTLQKFCEAFHAIGGTPKVAKLETKSIPGRAKDFLPEGFFVLNGHPVCVLKSNEVSGYEDEWIDDKLSRSPFLTFTREVQKPESSNPMDEGKHSMNRKDSTKQIWKVILLDNDQAGSLHAFFNYVTLCNLNNTSKMIWKDIEGMMKEEGFKLQVIVKCKLGPILVKALKKEIKQGLTVKEERGSGPYIKGPSYCTSLVVEGDPIKLLLAASAMPQDMVGRSSLKITAPNLKTFCKLFHANHTFGVDLKSRSIVLVKPLYVLTKVLEFISKLNNDAYEEPDIERTFIELIKPTNVL